MRILADTDAEAIAEARLCLRASTMAGCPTGPVVLIRESDGSYRTEVVDPFSIEAEEAEEVSDADILAVAPEGAIAVVG